MKTKTLFATILLSTFVIIGMPTQTCAKNSTNEKSITNELIKNRIHEIRKIDPSTLSSESKKTIKTELLEIKGIIQGNGGGVYISVGGLLLIIILLLVLF